MLKVPSQPRARNISSQWIESPQTGYSTGTTKTGSAAGSEAQTYAVPHATYLYL